VHHALGSRADDRSADGSDGRGQWSASQADRARHDRARRGGAAGCRMRFVVSFDFGLSRGAHVFVHAVLLRTVMLAARVPRARRLHFTQAMAFQADPVESAAEAGLHYVSDDQPGIRRKRAGSGFSYVDPDGKHIRNQQTLLRIKHLVIPPAWTDVWICPDANGHLQATGRDARGRKVYLYHPRWREVRDAAKYERLAAFGDALPRIRERIEADLRRHGIPREKVLAAVVKLLEETSIRVGNDEYREQNGSVGLTTMLDDHAMFEGNKVRFVFKGKSGKEHNIELNDRRLARIVKQCQEVPGQHLFQYLDQDGERHTIGSSDVNAYLKEISGGDFTAKDFRTWNGTVLAMRFLRACEKPSSATGAKKLVSSAIKTVAQGLGNTPAVARKAYVHPVVVNAYLEGYLQADAGVAEVKPTSGLTDEERCVLKLLQTGADELVKKAA
jgi:DNA topoisomerase I